MCFNFQSPKLHPVENFCSILKRLSYENNWEAQSIDELKNRIQYCLKKVRKNTVQAMINKAYKKFDAVY